MGSNKKLIGIILGALCIMGAIFYWLVSTTTVPTNQSKEAPKVAERAIENSTLEETKDGKKSWELKVNSLLYDNKKEAATMKGIEGKFYAEDGKVMTMTADEGNVNMVTKDVVLTKNPKGFTSDGATLIADKLTWINKDRQVLAEGNVRITKEEIVATAKKASMDVAVNKAKLEQEAKVTKGVKR